MKIQALVCPSCGAKLDVELKEGVNTCFCTYCGTRIAVTPEAHPVTNNYQLNKSSLNITFNNYYDSASA